MTSIGLISDTHGFLDENVFTHFENCSEIWHAGDFGSMEIAKTFKNLPTGQAGKKELKGVYGNIDGQGIRTEFPEQLVFMCKEIKVITHNISVYPPKYNQ